MASNLKELDPVQGLVDYVLDIKPYHTKIIEVLLEYVFNEPVNVTIEDAHQLKIDLFRPEDPELAARCRDGFSERGFGDPGPTPVVSPDQNVPFEVFPAIDAANNTFTIPNDRTFDFLPGTRVVLTSFIEDYGNPLLSKIHSIIDVIRTDAGTTFPAPAGTGAFVVAGDQTLQFVPDLAFDVFSSGQNDKTYVVRPAGSTFDGTNTTIPVAQAVLSGIAIGRLGLETSVAANTGIFTVVESTFNPGSIGTWPDRTDASTFRVGVDPHTVVTVVEPLTDPLLEFAPPLVYIAFVILENVAYEMVLSYSNHIFNYDGGIPISSQTPDEGFFRRPLVDYMKSTLDGFFVPIPGTGEFTVEGDVRRSNVFVGNPLRILDATDLQGLYTISAFTYDMGLDRTTFNVVEGVIGDTLDGILQIDIPANMFFVDGNLTSRFVQGTIFDIVGGNLQGTYTTLYSDFVNGKTRIRTFEEVLDVGHGFKIVGVSVNQFELVGNVETKFPVGLQFNVVGSNTNDGSYTVLSVSHNPVTNRTEIDVVDILDTDVPFGEIFPISLGFVHEHIFGFGESSDICSTVPETLVSVIIDEQLTFSGMTLNLEDDVIAYNLENTDQWGYELPFRTISMATAPPVPEQSGAPVGLDPDIDPDDFNALWFDTNASEQIFKQWNNVLPSSNPNNWKPITTAFWLEEGTNLFYYRTKNKFVDTGWIIFLSEQPGFNAIFGSVGRTEFVCREAFAVEDLGGFVAQTTFELQTCVVPHWEVVGVDTTPGASSFVVTGNVIGIDTAPFTTFLATDTPGNLNDGKYTILNAIFAAGLTTIFTKEDIPDVGIGGDLIHQTNLLMVRVNDVPAAFTFNSSTSFTVTSPELCIDDIVIADVFDQTATETNAIALRFGEEPHQVFHDNVITDAVNNAFALGGGHYARRFLGNFLFTSMDDTSIKGQHHAKTFPVTDVRPDTNEVDVDGDATWLFSVGRVAVLFTSQNNTGEYVIQSSSYNGGSDVTTIVFTTPTIFETQPKFNPPLTTRNIDGPLDTVEIYGDHTANFESGVQFLLDTQMSVVQTTPTEFVVTGNHLTTLVVDVIVRVDGSSTDNDQAEYTVVSSSFAGGETTVVVAEPIPDQVGGGQLYTVWTTDSSVFFPYVGPPLPVADPEQFGFTIISTVEDIPLIVHAPANTLLQYIEQNFTEDLGVLLGAVYDPSVAGVGDQPKTIVAANNVVDPDVNGIVYTWIGPLRMVIDESIQDNVQGSLLDGLGISNELLGVPDRYIILDTNEAPNTFNVHFDDPLSGLPVNLTDRFSPGTIFTVAGSFGEGEPSSIESNDARYVVLSSTWDEFGTGDTLIEIDTDLTNLPPYNTFTIVSMTNLAGLDPSTIELAGDQRNQFDKTPATEAFRLGEPLVSTNVLENVIHVTSVELSAGNTILTVTEEFIDDAFTGAIEMADASYRNDVFWDEANSTPTWIHGYIIREAFRLDTFPENTAATTINENFDFGWGTTLRWEIDSTDAGVDTIFILGDITGALDLNDRAFIVGSQGNDGEYEIASFTFNGTETEIVLKNPSLPVDPPAGLEGYFQLEDVDITDWFQYLIREINAASNVLILHGNATADIQLNQQIRVLGTPSNDGLFTVTLAPTYDGTANETTVTVAEPLVYGENDIIQVIDSDTVKVLGDAANFLTGGDVVTIVGSTGNDGAYVVEAVEYDGLHSEITIVGVFPDTTPDGTLQFYERGGWVESFRDQGIRIFWEDEVGVEIAETADGAVMTTGGSLLGSWEFPYWDVGSYDESTGAVIHLYSSTFLP